MPKEKYDAIVIGSGQGGGPLAGKFAAAGRRTALIERKHVGGSCVNEGCTPTKTLVASARIAYLARRASDFGVSTDRVSVDQEAVRQRKRDIVESFREGSRQSLEDTENLDLIMGEASFVAPRQVSIELNGGGSRLLEAETIVINTGARPRIPDVAGLSDVRHLDSTSIMELDAVPDHLIILGGGFIALEFGQMFRRFGSDVTVVEQAQRLVPREDEDVSGSLGDMLRDDGVELELGARAKHARQQNDQVELEIDTADGHKVLSGSHLLIAVGRTPNIEALQLGNADIETVESGHIVVNNRLETSAGGVYAIGDVKGGPAFTHISYDDHRVLKTNLLDGGDATIADRIVPYTVFVDPQYARVGLSEREAHDEGIAYSLAKIPMSQVARAIEVDETRGFMKVLLDPDSEKILGCAVLGIDGGEIMSMLQIAMMGGLTYTELRDTPFAHPTLAESLNNLFAKVEPA